MDCCLFNVFKSQCSPVREIQCMEFTMYIQQEHQNDVSFGDDKTQNSINCS